MKDFIRRMLARFGMFWLISIVTGLIILLACSIEYVSYQAMGISIRPAGWLMLIMMPPLLASPLLYVMLNQFRQLDAEHQRLLATQTELQLALAEVKELRGMLSMCAGCKKVRDTDEQWMHVDVYLRDNTHAEISHGLCPECIQDYD